MSLLAGAYFSRPFFGLLGDSLTDINNYPMGNYGVLAAIVLALALQIVGHALRAAKHKILLTEIRHIEYAEVFKGQMIGFMFNALLPLRLGELVRAHYIGKGVSISRAAVFATIVFERVIDLMAVTLAGALVLAFVALGNQSIAIGNLTAGLFSTLLLALVLLLFLFLARSQNAYFLRLIHYLTALFNDSIKNRGRLLIWSFIFCLKNVIHRKVLGGYLAMTVAMWTAYLGSIAVVIVALLPADRIQTAIGALASYVGVSAPLGPTYVANFSSNYRDAIGGLFASHSLLVVSTFVVWLVLVTPSLVLGLLYILRIQRKREINTTSVQDVMKNKLYRDADISTEFGHFLDTYFKGAELNIILNNYEVGRKFTTVKTFKGGSNALTLLAWQDEKLIVKKITLPQFADKLAAQYEWLDKHKSLPEITKVLGEKRFPDHYSIDIEYRDEFVTFFDFIHASRKDSSWSVLKAICDFTNNRLYDSQPTTRQRDKVDAYINDKVVGKIVDAANTSITISQVLNNDTIYVNGRKLINFNQIIKKIQQSKAAMQDLATFDESVIHGDLTVDNVIVDPSSKKFLLLDPNNENTISDPVTDYGKMFQSLHSGYEFLVLLKRAEVQGNRISFEENRSVQYDYLYEQLSAYLKDSIEPAKYRSILFHEAVHYCRLLTYRVSINPETAILFYGIAIRLFNDFLGQYDRKK